MLSISISLVAVFIPILLMGGIVGRLFREFAVTLSVAILRLACRVADDDADDVRDVSASEARDAITDGSIAPSERDVRLDAAAATRRTLALGAAASAR